LLLPYARAVVSELFRLPDGCLLVIRARQLVDWVGEGEPVTAKGVLKPVDVAAVGAALGVAVPARVRTAADVEAVHRPWTVAEAIGWLRVSANWAMAGPSGDDDPLVRWWAGVRAVLRDESHDDRGRGAPILARTLLTVMIAQLARVGATKTYIYDLGDHLITVERIIDTDRPESVAVCVAGQGDAPPEDWFPGGGREATPFDLAALNRRLSGVPRELGAKVS
jgi:pRiA4b ORF-3-like protein